MSVTLDRVLSLIPHDSAGRIIHGERKKFAETIGLKSGNLIADWVAGKSTSYTNYLYEISAKYGVSVEWLKGETDEKKPAPISEGELSAEKQELIDLFDIASPQLQAAALELLRAAVARDRDGGKD